MSATSRYSRAWYHWSDRKRQQTAEHRRRAQDFGAFMESLSLRMPHWFGDERFRLADWQQRMFDDLQRGGGKVANPQPAITLSVLAERHWMRQEQMQAFRSAFLDGGHHAVPLHRQQFEATPTLYEEELRRRPDDAPEPEPMAITITTAEQDHHADLRRRSYELALQRGHVRR